MDPLPCLTGQKALPPGARDCSAILLRRDTAHTGPVPSLPIVVYAGQAMQASALDPCGPSPPGGLLLWPLAGEGTAGRTAPVLLVQLPKTGYAGHSSRLSGLLCEGTGPERLFLLMPMVLLLCLL